MAIIQSSSAAGTVLLVDPAHGAARVSMRPMNVLGWNSVGVATVALEFAEASAF